MSGQEPALFDIYRRKRGVHSMTKVKNILFSLFATIMVVFSLANNQIQTSKATDVTQTIGCALGDPGKIALKLARTDYIQYLTQSKATTVKSENAETNISNMILNVAGYNVGKSDGTTPFERFGFSGIQYSSYLGEWAYYDVDPCAGTEGKMSNYGQYYSTRKNPLSTFTETASTLDRRARRSHDIRPSVFSLTPLMMAMTDTIVNTLLGVAKFILALTLAFIGFCFSDFSAIVGLSAENQKTIFTQLYAGIFLPLMMLMLIFTMLYLIYTMLWKGKIREGLGNLVQVVVCYTLAIILSVNTGLLQLPIRGVTALQAMIMSGFTNTISNENVSMCPVYTKPDDNVSIFDEKYLDVQTGYIKQIIGCRMWSEYLLKPTIKGQFGTDYENLGRLTNENEEWVGKPEVFVGKDNSIENWGLFYVSVMSGNHQPLDNQNTASVSGLNKDYYRIIDALSNYEESGFVAGSDITAGVANLPSSVDINANHWTSGDPYSHDIVGHIRGGIKAEQLDGFLNSTGIPYDKNRINGKLLLEWQNASKVDVRAIIAIAMWESSLGTAGVATSPGANMFGFGAFDSNPDNAKNFNDAKAVVELAKQTLLANKNRTFKRQDDKAFANAHGGLDTATEGGVYFTSTSGTGKKRANTMALIDAYIDANGGADEHLTDIGDTPTDAKATESLISNIPVVKATTATREWNYFIGNDTGLKFGQATLTLLFVCLGSILPIMFALMGIVYGVQLTLYGVLSPIFLLFGCWAGRGTDIAKRYFGTMLATAMKRIGTSLLLMISIVLVTNSMSLVNTVGVVQSIVFMIVMIVVISRKRYEILNMFQLTNFGQLQLSKYLSNATSKVAGVGKDVGEVAQNTVVGGIAGIRNGLGFSNLSNTQDTIHEALRGAKAGAVSTIKDKMYRSHMGRMTNTLINTMRHDESEHHCIQCGVKLTDGTVYTTEDGLYYCEECAAAMNFENLLAVTLNTHNEGYSFTTGNEKAVVLHKNEAGEITEDKLTHVTIDEWAKNQNADKAIQQASDSMAIVYDDVKNARNSYQNHSVKSVFIPTPLRTTLMNSDMRELTVKSQNEDKANESINEIEASLENAWREVLKDKLVETKDYQNAYLDKDGNVKNQEEADKWVATKMEQFDRNLKEVKAVNEIKKKEDNINEDDK